MSARLIFISLSALLLVQCICGKAVPNEVEQNSSEKLSDQDENQTEKSSADLNDREKVVSYLYTEYLELVDNLTDLTKNSLQNIIDDVEIQQREQHLNLTYEIDTLSGIVQKLADVSKSEDVAEKDQLFSKVMESLSQFLNAAISEPHTEEQFVLANSIGNSDISYVGSEYETSVLAYLKNFSRIVKEYITSLSPEERSANKKLLEAYEQYEVETDDTKQKELRQEILNILEEDQ